MLSWTVLLLTIVGTLLNAHGRREGFYFWFVTNAYWCAHNALQKDWPQTALFAFFLLTCVYGLFAWKKRPA